MAHTPICFIRYMRTEEYEQEEAVDGITGGDEMTSHDIKRDLRKAKKAPRPEKYEWNWFGGEKVVAYIKDMFSKLVHVENIL